MSGYKKKAYLLILFLFSLLSVFWMLSAENGFGYDDTTWMFRVSNSSFRDLFHFFPDSVHLDRPVGAVFLKLMYSAFGLDYCRHHVVLVIIHLINVLLTFLVSYEIFACKYEDTDKCFRGGVITAGFFGIWSRTHMAVQWDAAIFDLLGTFLCLLAMWFYFRYRNSKNYKGQNLFFTLFFYFLAIRTKEMFLVLPILLLLYEIWEMILEKRLKALSRAVIYSLFVFLIFMGILFYLKFFGGVGVTDDVNNPYYQSFNPVKMIHTLLKYSILCFDLENGGWAYALSKSGLIGTIFLLCGLFAGVFRAVRYKKLELLFCYLAIGISIVIVLPMSNQVHVLYLYFPSIFVGLLIACVVCGTKLQTKMADLFAFILLCLFMASVNAKGNRNTEEFWITNATWEMKAWRDIENIQAPSAGATIYIKNTDKKGYTPFFYGEGAVCKLLYQDASLNVELLTEEEWNENEFVQPYVLWEYKGDRVYDITNKDTADVLDTASVASCSRKDTIWG